MVRFVKGHGTENDFVVLPPGDGRPGTELGPELVRALCDRRTGIGADGVLGVVELAAPLPYLPPDHPRHGEDHARWFMDYWNADGTTAEMCGNGIRVFARYLVTAGLAEPGTLRIGTRAGVKTVEVPATGDVTVDMGVAERLPGATVTVGGTTYDGLGWSMGNPHLVVLDGPALDTADLTAPPAVDPAAAFPAGVNVELVERLGPRHVRMRVHERGVGETRSCGTGACAAAVAAMDAVGERAAYDVDVPGGRLVVQWCDDGRVLLTGPAVLVAAGEYPSDAESLRVPRSG